MTGVRPRQQKAIDDLRAAYKRGAVAPILIAPTGFGKSHTAIHMIQSATARGLRVWFMAHLKEILNDTADRLIEAGITHGYIWAGHPADRRQAVQVVSVQTAARRLDRLDVPDLIIVDEAHLAVAATYQDVFAWAKAGPKHYVKGGCKLLHLTATPRRLDGRGMGEVADALVPTCSTGELIAEGLLAPVRYLTPDTPDMSGAGHVGGDFNTSKASEIMTRPAIVGSALQHYLTHGRGRPGLGFCVDIKSARKFADEFAAAGLRTMAISGDDHDDLRDEAQAGLERGRLDFVFNCKLWVAGVDIPAISYIADLAPTESLTRYLQGLGRGLRTHPGKSDLLYADHAGNLARHGNPLAPRAWSLAASGEKRAGGDREMPVKQCPRCYATVSAAATNCICGHEFVTQGREIDQVDGELSEVDLGAAPPVPPANKPASAAKQKERAALIAMARKRGKRDPVRWAEQILRGRAARDERMALVRAQFGDAP